MKGVVIAGTSSSVGKTIATLAVLRGLQTAGYAVQPAKGGPDFIDPSHHEAIAGKPSRTLDPWLQDRDGMLHNYHRGTGDICVIEGMMGLYDGTKASTALIADQLNLPVILVIDASAGMESVAATALGFQRYAEHANRDITVAGIIAQRAHGGRHEAGIRDALPDDIAYIGRIGPDTALEIPDRHLGLHLGSENPVPIDAIDNAAETIDIDSIAEIAATAPITPISKSSKERTQRTNTRIAVASDQAFCFRYPATIEKIKDQAEIIPISPIASDPLPDCDGIYLPGGYPERFGAELQASDTLAEISDRAADGIPVYGECGGLMALAESLTTADNEIYSMAGVLPATVTMHDRYQALDHIEVTAAVDGPTATTGTTYRGHEFHYSSADTASDATFGFTMDRGTGIDGTHDGLLEYNSVGTYAHLHPETGAFDRFLSYCTQ